MATSDDAAASNRVVHRDVVCPFCAGACDELQITVEDEWRIVAVEGGCEDARYRLAVADREPDPLILVERQTSTLDEAVARTAEILSNARAPLIFGLERLTCEAQSLAVSLADRLGATLDSATSLCMTTRGAALQTAGESTTTMGELRDRADLVIFWEASKSICQFSRAGFVHFPTVTLANRPMARTVIDVAEVVDGSTIDKLTNHSDQRIVVHHSAAFEAVLVLRALVNDIPLDAATVLDQTGVALDRWQWLVGCMKSCGYGILVGAPRDRHTDRFLNELVIDLNAHTRFAYLNAALADMNDVGAEHVLTWRTGYPCSVNFAAGYPRFGPREHSTDEVLARGEADAVLAFGFPTFFSEAIENGFLRTPRIVLANHRHEDDRWPTVFIRTAQPGLHTAGTIIRFDGVPLPLRALVSSTLPSSEQVLKAILERLNRKI